MEARYHTQRPQVERGSQLLSRPPHTTMAPSRSRVRELLTLLVIFAAGLELFWVATAGPHSASLAATADELDGIIPNNFIVVLNAGVELDPHFNAILEAVSAVTNNPDEELSIEAYQMGGGFTGYAATLTAEALAVVSAHPDVNFVEPDRAITLPRNAARMHPREMLLHSSPSWGLGAISHLHGHSDSYTYSASAGRDTTAYIVSTGVTDTHEDFGGRVNLGYNAAMSSSNADPLGYGTALAGLVCGTANGVAKQAHAIGIKVLDDAGRGTTSGVISGLAWAMADAAQKNALGASALLLGYGEFTTPALHAALSAAVAGGMATFAGSGDTGCANAAAPGAGVVLVGAASSPVTAAAWSCTGRDVALWAPGVGVQTGTGVVSGGAFAAAYAAGTALYIARKEFAGAATPEGVVARLVELA
ncbi:peptidase S8/S53 domain-containing protein, partial [Geopyxis carbonaria]